MIVPNYENAMKLLGGIFGELQERMVKMMATFTEKEAEIIEKYLIASIGVMKEAIEKFKEKSTNR
jgi:hypothetical protein